MSGIRDNSIDSDWRTGRPGRRAKLAYILNMNEFTDVTFRLGGGNNGVTNCETIPAHKLVLSMYSSVFEAMFHGPLATKEGEVIDVPDIEPNAFKSLLKFIYSGEFDRESSAQEVLGVLYAARKYAISDLEMTCTGHLKQVINLDNAVSIFQTAQLLEVTDLQDEANYFLVRNFENVSKTDDFLNMTKDNLCAFLTDDDTSGCELDIFYGVIRWAVNQCSRKGLDQSAENHRLVLSDVLKLIRFPIISTEDFALNVVPTGVLTPEECTLLFQHMVVPTDNRSLLPMISFNGKKRNCSIYTASFYEDVAKTAYVDISAGWFNKFSVDQPISVVSFGFYGPHSEIHETAEYDIKIKLMKDSSDEPLLAEVAKTVTAKHREIFHVKFFKPIAIAPGASYRAWFALKGPSTCHGVSTSAVQEVIVPVRYTKYRHVRFTYAITGAHQLPEISFQV